MQLDCLARSGLFLFEGLVLRLHPKFHSGLRVNLSVIIDFLAGLNALSYSLEHYRRAFEVDV